MKNINSFLQAFLIVISLFLVISIIFNFLTQKEVKTQILTLKEFKEIIENQSSAIEKIVVFPQKINVFTKEKIFELPKDQNSSFYDLISLLNIEKEKFSSIPTDFREPQNISLILNIILNLLPFVILFWILWSLSKQTQKGSMQIFSFGKSGIKVYNPNDPNKITFKDVANLQEAKEELMEVVDFLKNPEKFLNIGAKIPRGVLLVGPPGSGKTYLARATAAEAGVPFFYISGSEFVELFVGIGASRVRDAFAIAKKNQPCILFIDEIDAIGKLRGVGLIGSHEEREQTLNQILVEMDGFEKETKVVVLAATNRPDVLDPALLRPGRFDRKIVLDLPDIKAREEILKIHLRDKKVGKINLKEVALRTPGFSGADLANLCNEAAILAARRNKEFIEQKELLEAIDKVILGPERKTKVFSKKEKEVAAYHEAGHAIVAHYLPHSNRVEKISIISRGRAGGYTLKVPKEERNFYFKKEFLDEIASTLGGYAAEKLIFSDVSTGPHNDLEIATELAKQVVTRFGMSEKLGPISLTRQQKEFFLTSDYSEKTAELIDEEVKSIINQALERANKVLELKIDKLHKVAKVLIKKEVIERKQFERLVEDKKGSLNI